MNYLRSWRCERCDKSQATIDRPKVEVCDACINAFGVVSHAGTRDVQNALERIAMAAYERGYRHGKSVAAARVGDGQ